MTSTISSRDEDRICDSGKMIRFLWVKNPRSRRLRALFGWLRPFIRRVFWPYPS